jgi:ABC-2 type transport system permease protein
MAGLSGAGETGAGREDPDHPRQAPPASLERAQYAAMAGLRWHMFINGLRSRQGTFELGARTVGYVFYALMGLGPGFGLGVGAYAIAKNRAWAFLPILFWVTFLLWQVVPIMLASFQEQFDLGCLLRFPVRFRSYFLLYLILGLADVSTILGALCCIGIWAGVTMVRPELSLRTALGLAVFAIFNILLVRAIFAWIDRWLAQRKTREILGAVFVVLMLSMQLFNPAFHQRRHLGPAGRQERAEEYRRSIARFQPWLKTANAVQSWLPPGLAARALHGVDEQQPGPGWASLGVLGLYILGAGGVLAARLRAEYRGENLGTAPSLKKTPRRRDKVQREAVWLLDGSGPIAAVMEKELRSLLRTLPLLYAIGAPLLLVLIFSGAFLRGGGGGSHLHVFPLALPVCVVYAQLGFTRLIYNNMGAEGAGIQIYFLSPTPIRTVMLAKNLFHTLMFCLVALTAGLLSTLRLGIPGSVVVAATGAWLLFSLPSNLAAGNVFSLAMAYRVNPGRMTRQGGSQANALGSLLVQVLILAVGAAVFGLAWFLGRPWLAVPIFLVLAGAAVFAWLRVLRNSDAMANSRKDSLMATLMKVA